MLVFVKYLVIVMLYKCLLIKNRLPFGTLLFPEKKMHMNKYRSLHSISGKLCTLQNASPRPLGEGWSINP